MDITVNLVTWPEPYTYIYSILLTLTFGIYPKILEQSIRWLLKSQLDSNNIFAVRKRKQKKQELKQYSFWILVNRYSGKGEDLDEMLHKAQRPNATYQYPIN